MKPVSILLAVIAVAIIAIGQWCSSWREASTFGIALAEEGFTLAVVSIQGEPGADLWRFSPGLDNPEIVLESVGKSSSLWSNPGGTVVIMQLHGTLCCYDLETRRSRWRSSAGNRWGQAQKLQSSDARHFITVRVASNGRRIVVIRSLADGKILGRYESDSAITELAEAENEFRFLDYEKRVIRFHQDGGESFAMEIGTLADLEAPEEWTRHEINGVTPYAVSSTSGNSTQYVTAVLNGRRPSTSLVLRNRETGELVASYQMAWSSFAIQEILAGLCLATACWGLAIELRGSKSSSPQQVIIDLLLIFGLVVLFSIDWTELESSRAIANAMLIPLGVAGLFIATLQTTRPLYVWMIVFAACGFPVLIPLVVIALVMRACGLRYCYPSHVDGPVADSDHDVDPGSDVSNPIGPDRRKFRFGIAEVMLATTAFAIFIAVGTQSLFFFSSAPLLAFGVIIALLVGQIRSAATLVSAFCMGAMSYVVGSWQSFAAPQLILATFPALVLCFSHPAAYGYRLRKRQPDESEIGSDLTRPGLLG